MTWCEPVEASGNRIVTSEVEAVQELRFGVSGCGGMASNAHCSYLSLIVGTKLVAYDDTNEDRAALLRRFGGE